MLIEMTSPVFRAHGTERPPIRFKTGLNVVLGKEDGENSIGKSSAMLAIDFVFGGTTYVTSDGVKHMGDHTIFFTFSFGGTDYRFARNTGTPNDIHVCGDGYDLTGVVWSKQQFVNWLKKQYGIAFNGLSFRETVSSFFRIYGKDNIDERRPPKGTPGANMKQSIDILIKLFNRYKDVEFYSGRLEEQKKKLTAFREARKYRFISDLVGGKAKFEENVRKIDALQIELDNLLATQNEEHSEWDIEKGQIEADLKRKKLSLETNIQYRQRRLRLLDMSMEYGLYPTEADLTSLQEFFPSVNVRKIYDVERYHRKLASILQGQFATEKQTVEAELAELQPQLEAVQKQISQLGFVGNLSKEFLDKHAEIKGHIDALKVQNEAYLTQVDLEDARKMADEMLKRATEDILADIERAVNDKMKEFNDSLFTDARKAPKLTFREYNSYVFETPDDTGTGSNYKGLIIYDLAILYLTALPAIAHDSLILKNIGDGAIDGIMRLYAGSDKQVFIAFDKQAAYRQGTQQVLSDNTVLKLSDNGGELYGESWNKEVPQDEDELQETLETSD